MDHYASINVQAMDVTSEKNTLLPTINGHLQSDDSLFDESKINYDSKPNKMVYHGVS